MFGCDEENRENCDNIFSLREKMIFLWTNLWHDVIRELTGWIFIFKRTCNNIIWVMLFTELSSEKIHYSFINFKVIRLAGCGCVLRNNNYNYNIRSFRKRTATSTVYLGNFKHKVKYTKWMCTCVLLILTVTSLNMGCNIYRNIMIISTAWNYNI